MIAPAPSLAELEQLIAEGLETFYQVGHALWQIREQQLYKEQYATFNDYCTARWGMKNKRAYQLMSSAMVYDNLLSTNVDTLPQNEAQTRPLASLSDELQPLAWHIAVSASDQLDAPLSHSVVKQAVKVVNELITTRAITVGSEQFSVSDLLRNQVVNEVVEARARQKQHIASHTQSKQVARFCALWNGTAFEISDMPTLTVDKSYQILVYTIGETSS